MLNAYRDGDNDVAVSANWANLAATKVIDANAIGKKFKHVEDNLAQELLDRAAGDETLSIAISTANSDRLAGDVSLSTALSNEIDATNVDISNLEVEIDDEVLARIAGDQGLSSEINTERGRIDAILNAAGGTVKTLDRRVLKYGKKGFKNPSFIARS